MSATCICERVKDCFLDVQYINIEHVLYTMLNQIVMLINILQNSDHDKLRDPYVDIIISMKVFQLLKDIIVRLSTE